MAISARIDELRKKFDENPRRYFAPLANEYRKAGDPGQAIFICETYLPQQPGHMSGHIVFGQALYELNRLDEARSVFETALSLDPENLIALRHLGDIARKTGDTTAARNWYQRVLEADPRNDEIAQIVASLASAPDTHSSEAPSDFGVTAETPTTLIMEPPVLPHVPESQRTPARGNLGLVEHFDTALSTPAMAPPPLAAPSLSATGALFDLTDNGPGEIRTSGPVTQVRQDQVPTIPEPSFSGTQRSLPTPPFELTAVTDSNASTDDLTFEPDSLAITAKSVPQAAETVEDDGHLDGAFIDESAFEPFSLGLPIPQFDETPATSVDQTPAAPLEQTHPESNTAERAPVAEEPPPLTFVEMSSADAIAPPQDEASAPGAVDDDELAMFLARHTQHTGIATPPSVPVQPWADAAHVPPPAEPVSPAEHESPTEDLSVVEDVPPAEAISPVESVSVVDVSAVEVVSPGEGEAPVEPAPEEPAVAVSALADAVEDPTVREVEETLIAPAEPESIEPPVSEVAVTAAVLAPPEPVWGEPTESVAALETSVAEMHVEAATTDIAAETHTQAEAVVETSALEVHVIETSVEPVEASTPDEHHADSREVPAEEPPLESFATSEPSGPPEAFVTETMAELYLQQGHLEPALDIYKKLVEQRPDDPQLKERLGAIERNLHGTHGAASADESVAEPAVVGPTIRDFLSVFATRARPVAETPPEDGGGVNQFDKAAQAAAVATVEDTSHSSDMTGTSAPDVSGEHGSIDALFDNADAHVTDVNAATVLADAFAPDDGRSVQPILDQSESFSQAPATPSQPAVAEASGDGFSFDQFFARDARRAAPTPRDSEPAPGDAADVAQFNQWLSGLKKPS